MVIYPCMGMCVCCMCVYVCVYVYMCIVCVFFPFFTGPRELSFAPSEKKSECLAGDSRHPPECLPCQSWCQEPSRTNNLLNPAYRLTQSQWVCLGEAEP